MAGQAEQQLRAYVEYLRDMGVHDFYRQGKPVVAAIPEVPSVSVESAVVVEPLEETRPQQTRLPGASDSQAGEFRRSCAFA